MNSATEESIKRLEWDVTKQKCSVSQISDEINELKTQTMSSDSIDHKHREVITVFERISNQYK